MKKITNTILLFFGLLCASAVNAQIPEKAEDISPILIGETLPEADLVNPEGKSESLENILNEKPTVLVFYRGGWCPYCNLQLSGLAKIEKDIKSLGYQIVAVSPDNYKELQSTENKDSINYKLYSDPDGKFIQNIGIAFKTPALIKTYLAVKNTEKSSNVIPVPTVMVVNKKGEILFEYINPNYKIRISGEMLLAVLKTIKQ